MGIQAQVSMIKNPLAQVVWPSRKFEWHNELSRVFGFLSCTIARVTVMSEYEIIVLVEEVDNVMQFSRN